MDTGCLVVAEKLHSPGVMKCHTDFCKQLVEYCYFIGYSSKYRGKRSQ